VKRAVLFFLFVAPAVPAAKDDAAPPQKVAAPASAAGEKPTPSTEKRVLRLQLKK
jgi:hypothetical protein